MQNLINPLAEGNKKNVYIFYFFFAYVNIFTGNFLFHMHFQTTGQHSLML